MTASIVMVTGGSRGIGAACVRSAAAAGHDIAFTYRAERDAADALAAEVRSLGRRCLAIQADMADETAIATAFATVDAELGLLRHLVNNAGVTGRSGKLADAAPAVIRDCIDINVTGAMLVAREAVKRMATSRGGAGGAIVTISSVAARIGSPGEYVWYAASKGAIDAFTLGLAKEVALEGIRVNAVSPGMVMTDIHALSSQDAGRIERIRPLIPMQRIGDPAEIASVVMFLLSDQASYMTGAVVDVSGGR